MKTALLIGVFFCCATAIAVEPNKQSKEIPLDQIWAYEMPGTRDIISLDVVPPGQPPGRGLVGSIHKSRALRAERLKYKDLARPGFAVSGSGTAALRAAHAVFVDEAKPSEVFSRDEEITIVFFSEPISRYRVQIRQVIRKNHRIEIRYELEGSIAGSITGHAYTNFALIPLGKMLAGKYQVEMRQLPHELTPTETKLGIKPLDENWSREFLCEPFSFSVVKKRS